MPTNSPRSGCANVAVVHRIRLRGGWRVERREDGSAVFERSFGSPRTLDAGESVWLVCERVQGSGAVRVNGQTIGDTSAGNAFAGDVTGVLLARNCVRLELVGVGSKELGEVGLEFRIK